MKLSFGISVNSDLTKDLEETVTLVSWKHGLKQFLFHDSEKETTSHK